MINNQDLLNSQYEIVGNGKWPKNEVYKENGKWYTDVVMVLDNTNSINDYELLLLGLKSESELGEALKPNGNFSQSVYKVSDIIGMEYNILTGSDYFNKDDSDKWTKTETTVQDADYVSSHTAVTARISAVIRPRKGAAGTSISTKLAYTEALTKHLVEHTEQSPVAQAQKEAFENGKLSIISGSKMTENQYKKFMQEEVGIVDYTTPISVNIYANSFEAKETIKAFTLGIQSTTHDVITHTGQVLNTAAADHNHRVLLQVVTHAGDVAPDFHAIGQSNTSDLTQSGVGLLGGHGLDGGADTALLGRSQIDGLLLLGVETLLQSGGSGLVSDLLTALSYQLVKRRH